MNKYVFKHPARSLLCLFGWEREKKALPESSQAFEVATAWISGLEILLSIRQTGFRVRRLLMIPLYHAHGC